ncbi:unnamed protein product, partial [Cladocopium goreaui]
MRCRRLCQRTPAGKLQVDPAIAEQWRAGGEQREALEMALLESLSRFGTARSNYKRIKNDFVQKTKLIRERLESRTEEILGGWYTEEALRKSGKYSNTSVKAIIKYCKKFPESLCRHWQYDEKKMEYYVIYE